MRDGVGPGAGVRGRLAHGWRLAAEAAIPESLISGYVRPAVSSVPPTMARRLGPCRIFIAGHLGGSRVDSQWTETNRGLEIAIAAAGREEHDVALELLLCLGQALWTRLNDTQRKSYCLLIDREIGGGIRGEIDEDALKQKRILLSGRHSAGSGRRLDLYLAASFAATAAEYVHCLWHDVTVRSGPEFLPAPQLKSRLELFARWFPPARGRRLFPRESSGNQG